jgi:hypothetical protein
VRSLKLFPRRRLSLSEEIRVSSPRLLLSGAARPPSLVIGYSRCPDERQDHPMTGHRTSLHRSATELHRVGRSVIHVGTLMIRVRRSMIHAATLMIGAGRSLIRVGPPMIGVGTSLIRAGTPVIGVRSSLPHRTATCGEDQEASGEDQSAVRLKHGHSGQEGVALGGSTIVVEHPHMGALKFRLELTMPSP